MLTPKNQIVLLGASNLTRCLASVLETAQRTCGGPSRFLIAAGRGRAYGMDSRILFRGLPGIIQCGLWDDLMEGLPTFALLTDLGNDIAYGHPAEKLIEHVYGCIERLAEYRAKITVTALPAANLERLSPRQYYFLRTLLFPGQRLTYEQALARVRRVNNALKALGRQRKISLIEPRLDWYGFDPVHIRRYKGPSVYHEIFKPWLNPDRPEPPIARATFYQWCRSQRFMPQYQRLFGLSLHRPQPTGWLPDGSSVSLY